MQGLASSSLYDLSEVDDSQQPDVDLSPIPDCEGIKRDGWDGKVLEAKYDEGSLFAEVLVVEVEPSASVDGQSRLGVDNVGVAVLDVIDGDPNLKDTTISWPVRGLFYAGVSFYDQGRKYEQLVLEVQNRRGRKIGKRSYQSTRPIVERRMSKYMKSVTNESIAEVYMQECCHRGCTRVFNHHVIRSLRTEMHLSTFKERCIKKLDVHRMIHFGANGKEKLVTVEGKEICLKGWQIIYAVPYRTFRNYANKAIRDNERGGPHGNCGMRKTKKATLQAVETLRNLLHSKADSMPHMYCTKPSGERVTQMVLPAGTRWKSFLPAINEVISFF